MIRKLLSALVALSLLIAAGACVPTEAEAIKIGVLLDLSGAYTYALLSQIGLPFYLCLIAGASISAIFGLLISLPAMRQR